jgi:hypothetical protein
MGLTAVPCRLFITGSYKTRVTKVQGFFARGQGLSIMTRLFKSIKSLTTGM